MVGYYLVTAQHYPSHHYHLHFDIEHYFEKYPTTDQLVYLLMPPLPDFTFLDLSISDFSLSFRSPKFGENLSNLEHSIGGTFPSLEYSIYLSGKLSEQRTRRISEISYKFFPDYNLEKFLTHGNSGLRELVKGYLKDRGK